jgi:hypothetical protein
MRALMGCGEMVEAVELYRRYSEHLKARYGLSPPPEMTDLLGRIQPAGPPAPASGVLPAPPAARAQDQTEALEPAGGAVPVNSAFYIARAADYHVQCGLVRQDSIILIKGPRQTGKSSLLARTVQGARRRGSEIILTDLETFAAEDMGSMDDFCRRSASLIAAQLDIDAAPEEDWRPMLAPGMNLERYLLRVVLTRVSAPVLWAVDDVDRLFHCPFGPDVFALLRSWHEKRSFEPQRPWGRLTVALACATEAHLYIDNLDQSPFNVGTRVEVEDFGPEQVAELNDRHGRPLSTGAELDRFQALFGGHPYLVRLGLRTLAGDQIPLSRLEELAASLTGPFSGHLLRIADRIERAPELRTALQSVLAGGGCPEREFLRLRSAGVLSGTSGVSARMRCGLYRSFLARSL